MEIKTKLSIGNEMYYMHENKVEKSGVKEISIGVSYNEFDNPEIKIFYQKFNNDWLREEEVFASKEELLKSL